MDWCLAFVLELDCYIVSWLPGIYEAANGNLVKSMTIHEDEEALADMAWPKRRNHGVRAVASALAFQTGIGDVVQHGVNTVTALLQLLTSPSCGFCTGSVLDRDIVEHLQKEVQEPA